MVNLRASTWGATAIIVVAAVGVWAAGCDGWGGHACGLVGCQDGLTVNATVVTTAVPGGTHTLEVTVDGTTTTCTFAFPPPAPDAGDYGKAIQCPSGLTLSLLPVTSCELGGTQTQASSTDSCEQIQIAGTPSFVRIQQEVGGTTILDQTLTPTYQTVAPNGESCGPVCHEATATFTIP